MATILLAGLLAHQRKAAIDMRLFRIPLREVEPGRHYEVRFKRQRKVEARIPMGKALACQW